MSGPSTWQSCVDGHDTHNLGLSSILHAVERSTADLEVLVQGVGTTRD